MKKYKKILMLIDLLSHRDCVSLRTIMDLCDLPKRTAFRYLREISEANIPVHHDKRLGGYRLEPPDRDRSAPVRVDEVLLTVLGLNLLAAQANDEYKSDIQAIIRKLLVRQPAPVEQIFRAFESRIQNVSPGRDCSELISSLLIHGAMLSNKKIEVTTIGRQMKNRSVTIHNPSLRFKREWMLVNSDDLDGVEASISSIKRVSIQ